MKVEHFQAGGCGSCARQRDTLKSAAEQTVPGVVWRDVDVISELDYAVEIGIFGVPAIAVDGELAFSSMPTASQLNHELLRRLPGRRQNGS